MKISRRTFESNTWAPVLELPVQCQRMELMNALKEKRSQFSIGSLMILVFVVSVPLALYHNHINTVPSGLPPGETVVEQRSRQGFGCFEYCPERSYIIGNPDNISAMFNDLDD